MDLFKKSCLVLFVIILESLSVKGEGSKEIYVSGHDIDLYLCNDAITHCNNGGIRNPFAIYGCDEPDRLYLITKNLNELVYFGFQQGTDVGFNNHVVFRILDLAGNIVYPETTVPTSGTGYINNIAEADVGPIQIYGAGGYTAIDWHPATAGTFYIEFMRKRNSNNNDVTGGFTLGLIDFTVYDSVALQVNAGRLFSKAWQFQQEGNLSNPGTGYYGTNYVYSFDSIVTSAAFTDCRGGIWVQFCNQWGCANTGNFASDRKSLDNQQAFVPEYPIFLNPPDSTLYPSASTLGQIVPPAPWGQANCTTGDIIFHVTVNKTGNVNIDLTFGGPYTSRVLPSSVVSGENLITWDGKDGAGVNVPNGILVTFTISYVNGLTNLPLYDVEYNAFGFIIGIVRPTGATPLVYWDDSNIPNGTTNLAGCLSPPGCHAWNTPPPGGFGNLNTINTWWYNVSTSSSPVVIMELRSPAAPGPITGLTIICPGSGNHIYWINSSPDALSHVWSYTGTGATITSINDTTISVGFDINATSGDLTVSGTNAQCGTGPSTTKAITISTLPTVTLAPFAPNCIDDPAYTLSGGAPPGGTYTIGGVPFTIFDPAVQGIGSHTVTYTYVNPVSSCASSASQDIVVNPLPVVTISPLAGVCISAPAFMLSGGIPAGGIYSGTGVSAGIFTPAVAGAGTFNILYTYTDPNGCINKDSTNITVFPLPVVTFAPLAPVCINIPPFPLSGGSPLGGTYSGAGVTAGSFNPAAAGAGIHPITYSYTNANGCTDSTSQNITVNPLPAAAGVVSGPATACQASTGILYTTTAIANATSYSWSVVPPAAATITGTTTTASVSWSAAFTGSASIFVGGVNNCGNGIISNGYQVTVNPKPVVTYTICTDSVTTLDASPFPLKGGIPLGGNYSGPGTNSPSAGYFNPAVAGLGTKPISYRYINTYGCSNVATKNIIVDNTVLLVCGNNFTDVRNNKSYQTVKIGTQCWMAENLNYGTNIPSNISQTDNCIVEKYCYNNSPANCNVNGGLYQWDELMTYYSSESIQGICPPGWHVPSENEWTVLFTFYVNNGFAGTALKNTGFSGFNGLLAGASFHNINWNFINFSGFFWSSSMDGPYKAWAHAMNTPDPSVSFYPDSRSNAYYVRCVHN